MRFLYIFLCCFIASERYSYAMEEKVSLSALKPEESLFKDIFSLAPDLKEPFEKKIQTIIQEASQAWMPYRKKYDELNKKLLNLLSEKQDVTATLEKNIFLKNGLDEETDLSRAILLLKNKMTNARQIPKNKTLEELQEIQEFCDRESDLIEEKYKIKVDSLGEELDSVVMR